MKIRAHVLLSGNVQGVFFRQRTEYLAGDSGVTGWIRNLTEGRVEALFEGEESNVKELVEFCRHGPPGAKVTKIEVSYEPYIGEFSDFRVMDDYF